MIVVYICKSAEDQCPPLFHRDFWENFIAMDAGVVDLNANMGVNRDKTRLKCEILFNFK